MPQSAGPLNGDRWDLVTAFTEVESGRRADRPELATALVACRLHRATLLIAKIVAWMVKRQPDPNPVIRTIMAEGPAVRPAAENFENVKHDDET